MRLPVKLSLLLAAATAFPLLLATAVTFPRGTDAVRSQLDQLYAQRARALAEEVHRTLVDKLDSLTLAASTLRLGQLDPEAREQALLLIYKETRGADVVGLFDAAAEEVSPAVRFATLTGDLSAEHEPVDDQSLALYAAKVPLQAALQAGLAVGPSYILPDAKGQGMPRLVLGVGVAGPKGQKWVLAVELSLRRLAESFERASPGGSGAAFLVDQDGRVVLHPDRQLVLSQANLSDHPLVRGTPSEEWLGASATVPLLGWKAVVQEPAQEALQPLRSLVRDAVLWLCLGLLVAVLLGFTSVRTVTRPLDRLREAALAVTGGALETTVDVPGQDEMAQLATAFNAMTRGLRERESMKLKLELSETLELDQVLDRLLDSMARAIPFDQAAALIKTRDGMDLVVSRGPRGRAESRQMLMGSAQVDLAISSHEPATSGTGQLAAVPLLSRGQVIGVLCLESRDGYDEPTTRLAFSLAQPAAMAVENARLFEEVQRLATLDGLTNTFNRRHFMELAQTQLEAARRFSLPLSALMIDVDHFKSVNDRYGHAIGDRVLRGVADRCRSALRSIDVLGRYGGEEFVILLPGTPRGSASTILAERIRRAVAEEPIHTDAGPVHVTVSLGVAESTADTQDLAALLKRADAALYEAKQTGRNRVAG